MNYAELKTALKSFQAQNYPIPALNSKKEVLEIALKELQAMTAAMEAVEAIAPEITETVVTSELVEHPETLITTSVAIPRHITPEHPALTELRELARIAELTLVWTIATVRTILKIATPHLVPIIENFNLCLRRGLDDLLKTVIVAGVLWQLWLFPKVELMAYSLALWAVMTAIRIKSRGNAIA